MLLVSIHQGLQWHTHVLGEVLPWRVKLHHATAGVVLGVPNDLICCCPAKVSTKQKQLDVQPNQPRHQTHPISEMLFFKLFNQALTFWNSLWIKKAFFFSGLHTHPASESISIPGIPIPPVEAQAEGWLVLPHLSSDVVPASQLVAETVARGVKHNAAHATQGLGGQELHLGIRVIRLHQASRMYLQGEVFFNVRPRMWGEKGNLLKNPLGGFFAFATDCFLEGTFLLLMFLCDECSKTTNY